jgi:hypothetical protein
VQVRLVGVGSDTGGAVYLSICLPVCRSDALQVKPVVLTEMLKNAGADHSAPLGAPSSGGSLASAKPAPAALPAKKLGLRLTQMNAKPCEQAIVEGVNMCKV